MQPVRSKSFHLALQFAFLGNCQVCELGKRNMCNQFVPKMYDFGTGCTSSGHTFLKVRKVSGVSGCVGKTVHPFDKLCAKRKSVSSVGKKSSINMLVSDIRKYFRQDININKYKHYSNVPAT